MTGLENIIAIIRQEAEEEARITIAAAEAEAEKIIADAKAKGGALAAELSQGGSNRANGVTERAKSAAQLETRKILLTSKQEIIGNIIAEAKNSLDNLDDEKYFEVLLMLLKRFSTGESGEMRLSPKDLKRIPAEFEKKIDGKITLSKEPANIKNGFLLIYGGIDINCTFDALFEEANEELQDIVSKIVF